MVSYKALNTIKESISLNARHSVRQCQFGQARATIERTIPDARHAVRDRHTRQFLTSAERTIAVILDISRAAAYALVKKQSFRSIRVGHSIRILRTSFDAWLEEEGL